MSDMDPGARPTPTVAEKLDALTSSMHEGFSAVGAALVEQRQYTEFAFGRLEGRFDGLEGRFDRLEGRSGRLERKLDQFIDTQSKTNELIERRLRALGPPESR